MDIVQRPGVSSSQLPRLGQRETSAGERFVREPSPCALPTLQIAALLLARAARGGQCDERYRHHASDPPPVHHHLLRPVTPSVTRASPTKHDCYHCPFPPSILPDSSRRRP